MHALLTKFYDDLDEYLFFVYTVLSFDLFLPFAVNFDLLYCRLNKLLLKCLACDSSFSCECFLCQGKLCFLPSILQGDTCYFELYYNSSCVVKVAIRSRMLQGKDSCVFVVSSQGHDVVLPCLSLGEIGFKISSMNIWLSPSINKHILGPVSESSFNQLRVKICILFHSFNIYILCLSVMCYPTGAKKDMAATTDEI